MPKSASGTSWGGSWELRGGLGRPLGAPGPLETPPCASEASQGGSGLLPAHLREALGSSREVLGRVSECFWDVSGSFLELRERAGSGQAEKVKITVFLKEFIGF